MLANHASARIARATTGVAVLGAVFALGGGGPDGLRAALLLAGMVQLTAAATAWRGTRPAGVRA